MPKIHPVDFIVFISNQTQVFIGSAGPFERVKLVVCSTSLTHWFNHVPLIEGSLDTRRSDTVKPSNW